MTTHRIIAALALGATALAGCTSTPDGAGDITLDAGTETLVVFRLASAPEKSDAANEVALFTYDRTRSAGRETAVIGLPQTEGSFLVASVPARRLTAVKAHRADFGQRCYDTETYTIAAEAGEVLYLGRIDGAKMSASSELMRSDFMAGLNVGPASPLARDTATLSVLSPEKRAEKIRMKRQRIARGGIYQRPDEGTNGGGPFTVDLDRVKKPGLKVRRRDRRDDDARVLGVELALTSRTLPAITPPTAPDLAAARAWLGETRPDLAARLDARPMARTQFTVGENTCAPGRIER